MIFFIFLFTTPPSGLLSQKDFSSSSSSIRVESPPDVLFLLLLTFFITTSFVVSQISVVSSSGDEFPVLIYRLCLAHVILYLLEIDIVVTGDHWVLESTHTTLEMTSGTEGVSSTYQLKIHLPVVFE